MSLGHVFAPSDFTYIIGELLYQTPDSFRIRYRTWFIRWIQVESSVRTGAGNCPEFALADEPCSVADTKTVRSLDLFRRQDKKKTQRGRN